MKSWLRYPQLERPHSLRLGFKPWGRAWFISALAAAPTPQVLEGGERSVAALLEALKPALTGEVLINGLDAGNTGAHLTRAAYSEENYRKLVALKDKYDPANVFRFNHNIAPSKGPGK
jgi:FAD/FMN-containing dehydrogenase